MTDAEPDNGSDTERRFYFYKGGSEVFGANGDAAFDWGAATQKTRESLNEALNARHLAFLMGSGCSSLRRDGKGELGISTMGPLAEEFLSTGNASKSGFPTDAECERLEKSLGITVRAAPYRNNLERLMEVLYSAQYLLEQGANAKLKEILPTVRELINKTSGFIQRRCSEGAFSNGDQSVVSLYQTFYRKLILRDRTLPRPWIFTTNYDLFNETALDRMGMPYCNGFLGTVERRFNPASFRYSLAEQLDIASRKWTAVDGYIYLCKLHGSINWVEEATGLFPVREVHAESVPNGSRVMIYPTPAKQSASFGAPYSDLMREFQTRVVREQSVLVVLGYSFGDEHINNLIFQSLTIPSFRLIAIADPHAPGPITELRELQDPRIWLIGGDGEFPGSRSHYFDTFVSRFMPAEPGSGVNDAIARVVTRLLEKPDSGASEGGENEE